MKIDVSGQSTGARMAPLALGRCPVHGRIFRVDERAELAFHNMDRSFCREVDDYERQILGPPECGQCREQGFTIFSYLHCPVDECDIKGRSLGHKEPAILARPFRYLLDPEAT